MTEADLRNREREIGLRKEEARLGPGAAQNANARHDNATNGDSIAPADNGSLFAGADDTASATPQESHERHSLSEETSIQASLVAGPVIESNEGSSKDASRERSSAGGATAARTEALPGPEAERDERGDARAEQDDLIQRFLRHRSLIQGSLGPTAYARTLETLDADEIESGRAVGDFDQTAEPQEPDTLGSSRSSSSDFQLQGNDVDAILMTTFARRQSVFRAIALDQRRSFDELSSGSESFDSRRAETVLWCVAMSKH